MGRIVAFFAVTVAFILASDPPGGLRGPAATAKADDPPPTTDPRVSALRVLDRLIRTKETELAELRKKVDALQSAINKDKLPTDANLRRDKAPGEANKGFDDRVRSEKTKEEMNEPPNTASKKHSGEKNKDANEEATTPSKKDYLDTSPPKPAPKDREKVAKWQAMLAEKDAPLADLNWTTALFLTSVGMKGGVTWPKQLVDEYSNVGTKNEQGVDLKKLTASYGPPDKLSDLKDRKKMACWGPLSVTYPEATEVIDSVGVQYWLAFAQKLGVRDADDLLKTGKIFAAKDWPPADTDLYRMGLEFGDLKLLEALQFGGRHLIALQCFGYVLEVQPKNARALLARADAMLKLAKNAAPALETKAVVEAARKDLDAVLKLVPGTQESAEASKLLAAIQKEANPK